MSGRALYLVWRPRRFDDVVGQPHVVRTIRNAVKNGTIAHAYLFSGPRGTGKTTMARLLFKAVNCLQPVDGGPCEQCAICTSANEGRAIDLIEMDAASNRGIDDVRDLREKINYSPAEARYRVYILDEAHQLTTAAWDALLKTLEEPPPHAILVLATTESHKVPPTVLSRCQRFDFHRHTAANIRDRLAVIAEDEGIEVEGAVLSWLARAARGGMRDAISLLDQLRTFCGNHIDAESAREVLGLAGLVAVRPFLEALQDDQPGAALESLNDAMERGTDLRVYLADTLTYLRALMLLRYGAVSPLRAELPDDELAWLEEQATAWGAGRLRQLVGGFGDALARLRDPAQLLVQVELVVLDGVPAAESDSGSFARAGAGVGAARPGREPHERAVPAFTPARATRPGSPTAPAERPAPSSPTLPERLSPPLPQEGEGSTTPDGRPVAHGRTVSAGPPLGPGPATSPSQPAAPAATSRPGSSSDAGPPTRPDDDYWPDPNDFAAYDDMSRESAPARSRSAPAARATGGSGTSGVREAPTAYPSASGSPAAAGTARPSHMVGTSPAASPAPTERPAAIPAAASTPPQQTAASAAPATEAPSSPAAAPAQVGEAPRDKWEGMGVGGGTVRAHWETDDDDAAETVRVVVSAPPPPPAPPRKAPAPNPTPAAEAPDAPDPDAPLFDLAEMQRRWPSLRDELWPNFIDRATFHASELVGVEGARLVVQMSSGNLLLLKDEKKRAIRGDLIRLLGRGADVRFIDDKTPYVPPVVQGAPPSSAPAKSAGPALPTSDPVIQAGLRYFGGPLERLPDD